MTSQPSELEVSLKAIASASPSLMGALRTARELRLSSWCIAAGAVRNLVWTCLHDHEPPWSPEEVDLVYFDDGQALEMEQAIQNTLNRVHPECVWDVTNQAHVHRWYEREFGRVVPPVRSLSEGIATWPEYATCVGLSLSLDGELCVHAPYGLQDLFALKLRHNPVRVALNVAWERVQSKRWLERWPKLQLVGGLANAAYGLSAGGDI